MDRVRIVAGAAGVLALLALALAPPAFAARSWRGPIPVSPPGEEVFSFDGALTPDGDVVSAWNASRSPELPDLRVAVKPAGGELGAPRELGSKAFFPTVASDAAGATIVAWEYEPPEGGFRTRQRILVSTRPANGSFSAPQDIGQGQGGISVATNARGDAVVFWSRYFSGGKRLLAALRPAGGTWTSPEDVTGAIPSEYVSGQLDVALTPTGDAIFTWQDLEDLGESVSRIMVAVRPATGPVGPRSVLSSSSARGFSPEVATDGAGRGIVVWTEVPPGASGGPVRAAIRRTPIGFEPAVDLGGTSSRADGPLVDVGNDGEATVAWAAYESSSASSGLLGPLRVTTGRLDTGSFGSPTLPVGGEAVTRPALAVDDGGAALLVYEDIRTAEQRATRRPPGGGFAPPLTLTCPRQLATAKALGADAQGAASILWRQSSAALPARGVLLSQDDQSPDPGPASCPPRPPPYVVSPQPARPGQLVTIDASGSREADAQVNDWQWDLDYNGTFELDTGEVPRASVTYRAPGNYWVGMKHTFGSARSGGGGGWHIPVDVRDPSQLSGPPPFGPPPSSPGRGWPPSPVPVSKSVSRTARVTLQAPALLDLDAARTSGIRARIVATKALRAVARITVDRRGARRLGMRGSRLGERTISLRALRDTRLRVPLTATARRLLEGRAQVRVTLEVREGETLLASQRITLRRRR